MGVRFADLVTGFPAGINAAATWDRDFIRHRGRAMGRTALNRWFRWKVNQRCFHRCLGYQFRHKGAHVQLGPMMNMGRNAEGGRNWEGLYGPPSCHSYPDCLLM